MNKRTKIKNIFNAPVEMSYTVMGWVRTFRNNQFIALNDGSCLANLQVVVDFESWDAALLKRITTGAA
ncbi:MAG: asparagine--tRNA ligase, partial [Saprospiraceae bacterium]